MSLIKKTVRSFSFFLSSCSPSPDLISVIYSTSVAASYPPRPTASSPHHLNQPPLRPLQRSRNPVAVAADVMVEYETHYAWHWQW
jgi:hypothetical protein